MNLTTLFDFLQEQYAPLIEDFLYMADGAFGKDEMIEMEIMIFKTINYELGLPLSYTFLRRFAKVKFKP